MFFALTTTGFVNCYLLLFSTIQNPGFCPNRHGLQSVVSVSNAGIVVAVITFVAVFTVPLPENLTCPIKALPKKHVPDYFNARINHWRRFNGARPAHPVRSRRSRQTVNNIYRTVKIAVTAALNCYFPIWRASRVTISSLLVIGDKKKEVNRYFEST